MVLSRRTFGHYVGSDESRSWFMKDLLVILALESVCKARVQLRKVLPCMATDKCNTPHPPITRLRETRVLPCAHGPHRGGGFYHHVTKTEEIGWDFRDEAAIRRRLRCRSSGLEHLDIRAVY